jgi:hypothetical protein
LENRVFGAPGLTVTEKVLPMLVRLASEPHGLYSILACTICADEIERRDLSSARWTLSPERRDFPNECAKLVRWITSGANAV